MEEDNTGKKGEGESSNEEGRKLTEDEIFELKTKECLDEINKNLKYIEEFEKYSPYSLDTFKTRYAAAKANISLYGNNYLKREEEYAMRYRVMAEKRFWDIQQKKLFDMQCEWRAEEIKIQEVVVSPEFEYWGEHISLCPFISPVTQQELELYMEFISSVPYDDKIEWVENWQDYDEFLSFSNVENKTEWDSREYPLWYKFHDSRTKQNFFRNLPNIRGEKESFYINKMREKRRKEWEEKEKNNPGKNADNRPWMNSFYENCEKFIEMFEDAKLLKLHKARDRWEELNDDRDLNNAKETLQLASEAVEMDYNENWRQGIIDAANGYRRKKILQELPKVYKDYKFRLSISLPFEDTHDRKYDIASVKVEHWKEDILDAREINDEPRDFNF
ncbi:MAG: hypothetical protein M1480_19055 [Bacteroidetes bacterium]|nr:hypothetical protein [Bacteroidota bacterium]